MSEASTNSRNIQIPIKIVAISVVMLSPLRDQFKVTNSLSAPFAAYSSLIAGSKKSTRYVTLQIVNESQPNNRQSGTSLV